MNMYIRMVIRHCESVYKVLSYNRLLFFRPFTSFFICFLTIFCYSAPIADASPFTELSFITPHNVDATEDQATSIYELNYHNKQEKGYRCECWRTQAKPVITSECRCRGTPKMCCIKLSAITITDCSTDIFDKDDFIFDTLELQDIILLDLPELAGFSAGFFSNFTKLRTIFISNAPRLTHVNATLFRNISPSFKTLRITSSGLMQFPDLSYIPPNMILHMVDLEQNQITRLDTGAVKVKTEHLILDNNQLVYIDAEAFKGSQIAKLSIKKNYKLKTLHPLAFNGIVSIVELDLSSTSLERLPTDGLNELEVLKIQRTHTLKQIPSLYFFKNLRVAYLTHSFHCCAFKFPKQHDPELYQKKLKWIEQQQNTCIQGISKMQDGGGVAGTRESRSISNENYVATYDDDEEFGEFVDDALTLAPNTTIDARCGNITFDSYYQRNQIKCHPEPDALNPCEDVMGFVWLRRCVWVVVLMAVFGNIAVLVVLMSLMSEMTVPKFLICHLAFADLCMGIYLLLLACIDMNTKGEFFNYAYDWQYGAGCQAAGFLTVFASHLSVFTLTVITLERWFAITHAIYLNRRIKLKAASYIMACGWIYSIAMAALPLYGVSNYSSTSICLPMEARDNLDKVYLVAVLALNGLAFVMILVAYAKIYFSLGKETRNGAQRGPKGEMTIAKKMALLVFTNFICWAPIVFFGITAIAGHPLIDVTKSKIILVFFYPINSCANPYLYAILTAQYRRDLFLLLSKFGICTNRAQKYKFTYSMPTHNIPLNMVEMNSLKGDKSIDDNGEALFHVQNGDHSQQSSNGSICQKSVKEDFI